MSSKDNQQRHAFVECFLWILSSRQIPLATDDVLPSIKRCQELVTHQKILYRVFDSWQTSCLSILPSVGVFVLGVSLPAGAHIHLLQCVDLHHVLRWPPVSSNRRGRALWSTSWSSRRPASRRPARRGGCCWRRNTRSRKHAPVVAVPRCKVLRRRRPARWRPPTGGPRLPDTAQGSATRSLATPVE
jgi:hypothetical protein